MSDRITIAILAKRKGHVLPLFLKCIDEQNYPKNKISIYIRSNNNTDNTIEILQEWVRKNKDKYEQIYEDYSDVEENVQQYGDHEWNYIRFKVLAKIRQESINFAINNSTDYFVVDCDNFIFPQTLLSLNSSYAPIIGPLLKTSNFYSNYHNQHDGNGYYKSNPDYYRILNREIPGFHNVDVIHCTYYIRNCVLDKIKYSDDTKRHEYVIFSESARKAGIPQLLDTRNIYGRITFAETIEKLNEEPWILEFN